MVNIGLIVASSWSILDLLDSLPAGNQTRLENTWIQRRFTGNIVNKRRIFNCQVSFCGRVTYKALQGTIRLELLRFDATWKNHGYWLGQNDVLNDVVDDVAPKRLEVLDSFPHDVSMVSSMLSCQLGCWALPKKKELANKNEVNRHYIRSDPPLESNA